jgi:hypothetical protein
MKEEMVNMVRKKRESGKDSFELTPEKANKLHDDRSYCMALCAWHLSEKRLESIRKRKPQSPDEMSGFFDFRKPKSTHSYFN